MSRDPSTKGQGKFAPLRRSRAARGLGSSRGVPAPAPAPARRALLAPHGQFRPARPPRRGRRVERDARQPVGRQQVKSTRDAVAQVNTVVNNLTITVFFQFASESLTFRKLWWDYVYQVEFVHLRLFSTDPDEE